MKAYHYQSKENENQNQFVNGQELIWDSGAGFDVVVYQEGNQLFNGRMVSCKMKTGIKKGHVLPISVDQLTPFSLKKWSEMRRKYDLAA
jgi:hypothetical protein